MADTTNESNMADTTHESNMADITNLNMSKIKVNTVKFIGINQGCGGKKCLGSSSLETLVIYRVCKCDTDQSVMYLMREGKGKVWRAFVSHY